MSYSTNIAISGAAASLLATAVGAFSLAFAEKLAERKWPQISLRILMTRLLWSLKSSMVCAANSKEDERIVAVRIHEAARLAFKQEAFAKWVAFGANALTVAQYIVGGLLVSSFLQSVLTRNIVGFLGLIVLACKLINQHFHPEQLSWEARQRAVRLRQAIRQAEDELCAIKEGKDAEKELIAIRQKISSAINEAEAAEIRDAGKRRRKH